MSAASVQKRTLSAFSVQIHGEGPTTTAPPDSALRLELRPGELVLWDGRVCRLESLRGARARIPETIGADIREVPVTELRGVPSFTALQLDQRLETLRGVDQVVWTKAQQQ